VTVIKYFWVQAEILRCSGYVSNNDQRTALLGTNINKLWQYSWSTHGLIINTVPWFRIFNSDKPTFDDCQSPAGKNGLSAPGRLL